MSNKLQQLFDEYSKNETEFTYAHYLDPKNAFCLKVGLVGCYYLNQAYQPEKRAAIGKVLALYDKYWGNQLDSGYYDGNPNKLFKYSQININKKVDYIVKSSLDNLCFYWSSVDNLEFVPEYFITSYSRADWYEELHKDISYVQFYLPIDQLEKFGVDKLVEFNREVSEILQPMHGFFGLGIQHSHEYYDYQYLEFEIAHQFLGFDVSNAEADLRFRGGFKCINWLTILGSELVDGKLSGLTSLKQKNHDEDITFYPYRGGVLIRAGEVPELGNVATNPYPEHYINVNNLVKAARAPEIGSLGFGSINGEIRFNNRTSKNWQSRFDGAMPTDTGGAPPKNSENDPTREPIQISVKTGELCPFTGFYATTIKGKFEYREMRAGYTVEPFIDSETGEQYTEVRWQLLRRDDGGNVFI